MDSIDPDSNPAKDTDSAEQVGQLTTDTNESVSKSARSLSIRMSTIVWLVGGALLTGAVIVFAFLWLGARSDLADRDQRDSDNDHAEQIATDYAVGAATVNFQDFDDWVIKLKANTVPALANKFDATAPQLREILTPLQWTSTAEPITAKVMSSADGTYKVNVFVTVTSTNAQNPEGTQTTVTYDVTVIGNDDWKVSDVGGMDGALPAK
jgi:Mce-associated membrane protein